MDENAINWHEIAAKLPRDKETKVQPARLPEREFWILIAATTAMKRTVAANSQSLLVSQIRRHSTEWFNNIAFLAAQEGVSFEEMFVRLCVGDSSDDSDILDKAKQTAKERLDHPR